MDLHAVRFQDLADQQAQFSIAKNCNRRALRNFHLVENLARGCQRLDENGMLGSNCSRHTAQITLRQRQEISKCPRMLYDAQHSALRAMAPKTTLAPLAFFARQINFANHALTNPRRIVRFNHLADEFMPGDPTETVVAACEFKIRIANASVQQLDQRESFRTPGTLLISNLNFVIFETNGSHIVDTLIMLAELACFEQECGSHYPITEPIYNCTICGALLEVRFIGGSPDPKHWKRAWRDRRTSNDILDQSGVWRYRELLPFDDNYDAVTSLREGNTPLLNAPGAAKYGGLDQLTFKHQGFNPTGSFKDNGMTCGVAQAVRLGRKRVACVSTGNTSASMAAYSRAAGLDPIVFIPHGEIAYGKLAQALEYGARTLQVEANFDQILALVRHLADRLGIYLLNSINPFRIEGQKTIVIEMMDQRDWNPPDWIVLPGGNLGNTSAFGKALRELHQFGFIQKMPRLAVIQAEGSAPFYEFMQTRGEFRSTPNPRTLATAIRIGDPVSWPKALHEITMSNGVVEKVSEQEIADAKAVIGRCGIGCEPASAATLAGIRKLTSAGVINAHDDVIAVLTGNLLKDPDYIYRYHTGQLKDPEGKPIQARFANQPVVVPNDVDAISRMLEDNSD
jgi:threonine synthase